MPEPIPVPTLDLGYQHRQIAEAVTAGFAAVMERSAFVLGAEVQRFESEYAAYLGARRVVGVGNGTDALELALRATGIGPGDEVIVPANTFVATAEAVVRVGAVPRFADCDEQFLLAPSAARAAMTAATAAVMVVHLYGRIAAVTEVRNALAPGIVVVEDAAQSQGARGVDGAAGTLGDVAATSFYPGKNLGAYGDAGAVMTGSDEIADRVLALRNHGGINRYEHLLIGANSRLDTLQAVVLSEKLRLLDGWNAERRRLARRYDELLRGVDGIRLPELPPGEEHVFHQYVVLVDDRDRMLAELNAVGIGVGIHYPTPVHLLPAFAAFSPGEGAFPVAEAQARRLLSLPLYPGLSEQQQDRVADELIARR